MIDFLKKMIKNPFVVTLLLAILVSCGILYGTLKWLDKYTRHNEAVIVPDVRGMRMKEAEAFFKSNGLRYSVIDSVFSKSVKPGAIVEIMPAVGSKVKEGRIVFITVNAVTSQMSKIPEVEDMSYRQAYALLRAQGFENIKTEYVPGVYKDLAIGIELNGRLLNRGEMVQLSAPLVLKISNGETILFSDDSIIYEKPITPINPNDGSIQPVGGVEDWFGATD
ncbi:MAG: PASTA domain-containing protein [Tannerellaceae bacterium]|jgi:beta-lactam-binding protein with PASTA domain|nr:PASTA domain-containing protein [Tannerellaceae bacterium]